MNDNTISINGFTARVSSEEKYLYLKPVDGKVGGRSVDVEGKFTPAVVAAAVAEFGHEVELVMAVHYRYCSYSLRYIMRERSGAYTRTAFYEKNDAGKWVRVSSEVKNEMY